MYMYHEKYGRRMVSIWWGGSKGEAEAEAEGRGGAAVAMKVAVVNGIAVAV